MLQISNFLCHIVQPINFLQGRVKICCLFYFSKHIKVLLLCSQLIIIYLFLQPWRWWLGTMGRRWGDMCITQQTQQYSIWQDFMALNHIGSESKENNQNLDKIWTKKHLKFWHFLAEAVEVVWGQKILEWLTKIKNSLLTVHDSNQI